jgi:flagellar biosynthesis protein FliQ
VSDSLAGLVREGFLLLTATGGPLVGVLLVAGLVVGVFQATTQINDPALGFVPRLLVALLGAFALGGWVLERFARFFASALGRMAQGF